VCLVSILLFPRDVLPPLVFLLADASLFPSYRIQVSSASSPQRMDLSDLFFFYISAQTAPPFRLIFFLVPPPPRKKLKFYLSFQYTAFLACMPPGLVLLQRKDPFLPLVSGEVADFRAGTRSFRAG